MSAVTAKKIFNDARRPEDVDQTRTLPETASERPSTAAELGNFALPGIGIVIVNGKGTLYKVDDVLAHAPVTDYRTCGNEDGNLVLHGRNPGTVALLTKMALRHPDCFAFDLTCPKEDVAPEPVERAVTSLPTSSRVWANT